MYPDDRHGLGRILRRCKDRAAVDDVVLRANIDEFFGELPGRYGYGTRRVPLPKQESCPQKGEYRRGRGKLTPRRRRVSSYHRPPRWKGIQWMFSGRKSAGWHGPTQVLHRLGAELQFACWPSLLRPRIFHSPEEAKSTSILCRIRRGRTARAKSTRGARKPVLGHAAHAILVCSNRQQLCDGNQDLESVELLLESPLLNNP
jgi:hypothetical protein